MPRASTTAIKGYDSTRDDTYMSLLSKIMEDYKLLINSEHSMASQLVDKYTDLFRTANRQHSLIAALRDKGDRQK